jgi:hypothetical protein
MRGLLFALALLLALASPASAAAPNWTQWVRTMEFKNGVSPLSSYSGTGAVFLTSVPADSGKNLGAATTLSIGTKAQSGDSTVTLLYFDISALPDSARVLMAELWLYQTGPAATVAAGLIGVQRLVRQFVEGVGGDAGSVSSSSATWHTANATQRWGLAAAGGASQFDQWWRPGTVASAADSATYGANASAAFWGVRENSPNQAATDIEFNQVTAFPYKRGATAAPRFGNVIFDVTGPVNLWASGAAPNYGLRLSAWASPAPAPAGTVLTFASDDYVGTEAGHIHRRPMLKVWYIDVDEIESESSGGGATDPGVGLSTRKPLGVN